LDKSEAEGIVNKNQSKIISAYKNNTSIPEIAIGVYSSELFAYRVYIKTDLALKISYKKDGKSNEDVIDDLIPEVISLSKNFEVRGKSLNLDIDEETAKMYIYEAISLNDIAEAEHHRFRPK
jgi:hypothetical protein